MKQSDRIQYIKEYNNHPLKGEYERKRSSVLSNKPFSVYLINLGYLFFLGMFILYGWMFFSDSKILSDILKSTIGYEGFFGDLLLLLALGIGNIILGLIYMVNSAAWKKEHIEIYNKKALDALNSEYSKKRLYHMTEEELYKHECCEYDDWNECWVCSATKEHLPYSEIEWCSRAGNCRYCKRFVQSYLGNSAVEYWYYEFKK